MISLAYAFCDKDKALAVKTAAWIRELGGAGGREALVCVPTKTNPAEVVEIFKDVFSRVSIVHPANDLQGWPEGPNSMFQAVAWHVHYVTKTPFLFMEPDAIPCYTRWLVDIDEAYLKCRRPFMGARGSNVKIISMNGVGVYPAQVCNFSATALMSAKSPWDLNAAREIVPRAHFSNLFQNIYFSHEKEAPTFPRDSALILPGTALFHRNKDGTLIDFLRGAPPVPVQHEKEEAEKSCYIDEPRGAPPGVKKFFHEVGEVLLNTEKPDRIRQLVEELATLSNENKGRLNFTRNELKKAGLIPRKKR